MAVSMRKFVDITSGTLPAGASDRELILRLITNSSGIDNQIEPNVVYECETVADVLTLFDSNSAEYGIALKYFGFISLSATKAAKISFWRPGYFTTTASQTAKGTEKRWDPQGGESEWWTAGETIPVGSKIADDYVTSLTKMADMSDNFATFFFVNTPTILNQAAATGETDKNWAWSANAIAAWTAEGNYKFRFVMPVDISKLAKQTGPITWQQITAPSGAVKSNDNDAETYLSRILKSCVTAVLDDAFVNLNDQGVSLGTTYPQWLTCALLASTKYARSNSTIIQEFKALDSSDMLVTCQTDSLYTILTKLNVNFFGQTQKAGKKISFYMEGYNLDGTDTSVCDNEIWLKDRITTEVFNRFVKCNKVPAGLVGRSMIKAAINGVIAEGLNNLAVQPEKTISESDKAAIIQNTGATDAPASIYTQGYYLAVQDGTTEIVGRAKRRVVDYILYYSTGEGIRKVTGSHVLV